MELITTAKFDEMWNGMFNKHRCDAQVFIYFWPWSVGLFLAINGIGSEKKKSSMLWYVYVSDGLGEAPCRVQETKTE